MNNKSLIICFNLHQLEKALYLEDIINRSIKICCLASIETKFLNLTSSKIITYSSPIEIYKLSSSFGQVIFFSMVPSRELVQLLFELKRANKNVIAIQETHQLSTHDGEINNLTLPIDSILAASDREKEIFEENGFHIVKKIFSLGWLFQRNYLNFVANLYNQGKESDQKINILLIFSAPNTIALGSQESFESRIKVINFLQKKYPKQEIHLKLHPQEKLTTFDSYLKRNKKGNTKIVSENESMHSLLKHAELIVVADKTQAALDLSSNSKSILIYSIGKKNFISEYLEEQMHGEIENEISFFLIKHPEQVFSKFHQKFFKSEENTKRRILHFFNNNVFEDFDYKIELALWKKVFDLKLTVSEDKSIRKYIEFNSNSWLDEIRQNTTLRNVITVIGLQQIARGNVDLKKNIITILNNFLTPQVFSTFTLDALNAYFYARYKNINITLHPASKEILEAYRQKSNAFIKLLYIFEKKIYSSSNSTIRSFLYLFLISMTRVLQSLRNKR